MYNIYDGNLAFLGELEGVTSANWNDKWDEVGGISLTAALTDRNEALLGTDRFIEIGYLSGTPDAEKEIPAYLICNVERDETNRILTVNGKTADYLLKRRSVASPKFADTTVPDAAQSVVEGNLRGLPFTVWRFPGDSRSVPLPAITLESGTLDELAFQLLRFGGYGRQLRRQGGSFAWMIDPGRDRRHVPAVPVFSGENGSARGASVSDDDSLACNVAVGLLHFGDMMPELAPDAEHQQEYQDGWVETYSLGQTETTGTARRELWCGEFFQEDEENEAEFRARVKADMEGTMLQHVRVLNFTADIDPADYGTLYRTGDMLQARAGTFAFERRVTEVRWTYDLGGTKCTLQLGPPTINVLREQKMKKPAISSAVAGGIGGAMGAVGASNKKILDLHRKWLNMVIQIGEVSAGLEAQIQNFDEFQQAALQVFTQVEDTAAGLDLIAAADVRESLKGAKTTLYAKIGEDFVKQAYLELYAVTDGKGNSKTLAEIVADAIYLDGKTSILNTLTISGGNAVSVNGSLLANSISTFGQLSGRELVVDSQEYVGENITSYNPTTKTYETRKALGHK